MLDHAVQVKAQVYMELPRRCGYWNYKVVQKVMKRFAFRHCIFDGCMYGITTKDGMPLQKQWRVSCINSDLPDYLNDRCDKSHEHGVPDGKELRETQMYTRRIAQVVHGYMAIHTRCPDDPLPASASRVCMSCVSGTGHTRTCSSAAVFAASARCLGTPASSTRVHPAMPRPPAPPAEKAPAAKPKAEASAVRGATPSGAEPDPSAVRGATGKGEAGMPPQAVPDPTMGSAVRGATPGGGEQAIPDPAEGSAVRGATLGGGEKTKVGGGFDPRDRSKSASREFGKIDIPEGVVLDPGDLMGVNAIAFESHDFLRAAMTHHYRHGLLTTSLLPCLPGDATYRQEIRSANLSRVSTARWLLFVNPTNLRIPHPRRSSSRTSFLPGRHHPWNVSCLR